MAAEVIKTLADMGCVLRARRIELGMDQESLASISGVPQSNLSRIERGLTPATLETYLRLTAPLGIELLAQVRA